LYLTGLINMALTTALTLRLSDDGDNGAHGCG
jgi:hypothetical protein